MNPKTKFAGIAASLLLAIAACAYFLAGKAAPEGTDAATRAPATANGMAGGKISAATPGAAHSRPATEAQYPDAAHVNDTLTAEQIAALGRLEKMLEEGTESPDDLLRPIRVWAKSNPAACAEWVAANLTGATRARCLEETIAEWSLHSPKEALAWLDRQPSHEGNEGSYLNGLANFSHTDAVASAAWLKAHPDLSSVETWQIVACAWAESDSKAALAWMGKNLDPAMKDNMLPSLLGVFRGPDAAQTLLAGTSAETAAAALTAAAKSSAAENPAFAMTLAQKISDADARQALTAEILAGWMETDADAAKAFLARDAPPR